MQELQNVQQQARGAADTELRGARDEYDALLARQAAVLGKLDVSKVVAQMRSKAKALDKGEAEREEVEGGGNGPDALTVREVKQLMDRFKGKRVALHSAEIQATAADQLQH